MKRKAKKKKNSTFKKIVSTGRVSRDCDSESKRGGQGPSSPSWAIKKNFVWGLKKRGGELAVGKNLWGDKNKIGTDPGNTSS